MPSESLPAAHRRAIPVSAVAPLVHVARVGALAVLMVAIIALAWRVVPRLELFIRFNTRILHYPWVVDYDEGVNIASAWYLSQGQNPYPSDATRFISTPYPPLFTALGALLLHAGGLSWGLIGGRWLSLSATLLTALLTGLLVWLERHSLLASALGGLLYLTFTPVIIWASFYKQDMLAVALALAGLCWLARWPAGWRVYGALPWLILAVYTKQTALVAPVAAIGYLCWREWRAGLRFGVACLSAILGPGIVFELLTGGGFLRHVVRYQLLPWQQAHFMKNMTQLVSYHALLLLLAALGGAILLAQRRPTLIGCYTLAGLGSLAGNGTVGANYNHLLEILLICCLLLGVLVSCLLDHPLTVWRALALAGVLALITLQMPRFGSINRWYDRHQQPGRIRAERLSAIEALIAHTPGDVFSDDSYMLLLAGKPLYYTDLSTMGPLARSGQWDETPFVRDLQQRRFALIVLNSDPFRADYRSTSWSPAALAAFRANYRLLYRDAMFTFVPRR